MNHIEPTTLALLVLVVLLIAVAVVAAVTARRRAADLEHWRGVAGDQAELLGQRDERIDTLEREGAVLRPALTLATSEAESLRRRVPSARGGRKASAS